MGGFSGHIGAITGNAVVFVFAGPVTTLTTTASQSIIASGSAALGSSAGSTVDLGICISPTGVRPPMELDIGTRVDVTPDTLTYSVSAIGAPGAGTWDVGMCVGNVGPNDLDTNDRSVGYAFVANGTPVSFSSKNASKSGHNK